MQLIELIGILQRARKKYGNIDVRVWPFKNEAYPVEVEVGYFMEATKNHFTKKPIDECIVLDDQLCKVLEEGEFMQVRE